MKSLLNLSGVSVLRLALGMMAGAPACAQATPGESVDAVAAAFGARENVSDISMSPNGAKIAFVQPAGASGQVIRVVEYDKDATLRPIMVSNTPGESIRYCTWPTDEQLICKIVVRTEQHSVPVTFSRLAAVYLDGTPPRIMTASESSIALGNTTFGGSVIDWNGRKPGEVLMTREYVPERSIGTHLASSYEGIGVETVDVKTMRRVMVEKPSPDSSAFISDGRGTVRIMGINPSTNMGYSRNLMRYFYRTRDSREWRPLSEVVYSSSGAQSGFDPQAVDPGLDVAYGFDYHEGYLALFSKKLDGSEERKLVFAEPGRDVDSVIGIGRSNRVVGVSLAGEYRRTAFFDPQLAALRTAFGKALPGSPAISFVDSGEDEKNLIMFAGSDVDPGRYYMYGKDSRKLEELLALRPQLAGRQLAEMKPVRFPAKDGTMVPGYLTLPVGSTGKGLPAIVMPHGGPSSHDEWGFDWLVQFFAARGFAVLQPNFRGSSGQGEAWFEKNGFQSWRAAVGDVDDAGRWLVSQGIASADRLAIVGWSYGGYAALQSGVLDPGLFKAIVAIAPVTDLEQLRRDHVDYSDYKLVDAQIGSGPHVREGSPAQNAAAISAPVLMFHGEWDMNVEVGQSKLMERRLREAGKPVELVTYPQLEHSLVDSNVRAQMLAKTDAFLRKSLAMPVQ